MFRRGISRRSARIRARAVAMLLGPGLLGQACSKNNDGEAPEQPGELAINLAAAAGVRLSAASYSIDGDNFSKQGSLDVNGASRLSRTVGSIPLGSSYTLELDATSEEDGSTCGGTATFDIEERKTTSVSIYLRCGGPSRNGSVLENGALNVCPLVNELSVTPTQTVAGGTVTLAARGSDADEAPSALRYSWTTSGGTLSGHDEPNAVLTSDRRGEFSVTLSVSDGDCSDSVTRNVTFGPLARRVGPVITREMLPGADGENFAGPSPVAAPDGLRLYFADHAGTYIRLALADFPVGPWRVHAPGTFPLSVVLAEADRSSTPHTPSEHPTHIAAPDVHLLDDGRWRMYFHARPNDPNIPWGHENGVATSEDGLDWHLESPKAIRGTYLRGFRWEGEWYGVMRAGELVHSADGVTWSGDSVPEFAEAVNEGAAPYIRHVALALDGDVLSVFYSRIADAPERIMRATVRLSGPWTEWRLEHPVEVLRPEADWEGADLPVLPSRGSVAKGPGNELRDPGILDHEGRRYLYYAYGGERGIGVAELLGH